MRTFVTDWLTDWHQKSKMITSRWTNVWEYESEIWTQGELRLEWICKWITVMKTKWRQNEDNLKTIWKQNEDNEAMKWYLDDGWAIWIIWTWDANVKEWMIEADKVEA